MPRKERRQNRIELLQGTLDMLILKTLQWGAQHGYGISQATRFNSSDVLQVETGSLYPALHRAGEARMARVGKEANRKQPARQILPPDRDRQEATGS
jgi:PadR family transcriptional regulator, regulatory protein PadR